MRCSVARVEHSHVEIVPPAGAGAHTSGGSQVPRVVGLDSSRAIERILGKLSARDVRPVLEGCVLDAACLPINVCVKRELVGRVGGCLALVVVIGGIGGRC